MISYEKRRWNSTRSCGPVLLVSLHSRCRGGQRLPRRPRLLRPLAVSCCVHHGSMGYVHQLQGIEERRRVSAAQVWIAPRQMFDGRAGFEVCAARVRSRRFHVHLADLCMCAIRVGRRNVCSAAKGCLHRSRRPSSMGMRTVLLTTQLALARRPLQCMRACQLSA